MIYGSVCSGIEAATVAWHSLGWRAAFYSEIDAFPSALLSHYYQTPNFGDMTKFHEWPNADIDVLVGGTPCQAFSIAGLRKGLADPRGNLTLTYLALAGRYRPDWILWENVPGVLSQDGGRAFGAFLGGLAELGYGWAYRVLDAQYFKLAQRRPRVFVVASSRGWASAAAVLFEPESLRGHPAPSRAAREDVSACLETSTHDWSRNEVGAGMITHALSAEGCDASEDGTGRGTPIIAAPFSAGNNANGNAAGRRREDDENLVAYFDARQSDVCEYGDMAAPLGTEGHTMAVAFAQNSRDEVIEKSVADSLKSGGGKPGQGYPAIRAGMAVRRLTPRECERLQGFPDDYTLIPFKGKPAKDTPRYKALGNSMAVPVMRWLGSRIEIVESLAQERAA